MLRVGTVKIDGSHESQFYTACSSATIGEKGLSAVPVSALIGVLSDTPAGSFNRMTSILSRFIEEDPQNAL